MRENTRLGNRWPSPRVGLRWGGSGHHWHLLAQCFRSHPGLSWPLLHHSSPSDTCWEATWAPSVLQSNCTAGWGWWRLGSDWLWATKGTFTQSCVWAELWMPAQAMHWTSTADRSQELTWAPLASVLPTSGARLPVWREGKTHTKRQQSQLGPNPCHFYLT